MSKFTAGKWMHNDKVGNVDAISGTGEIFPIAYVNNARNIEAEYVAEHEGELEANARLIASAPEMYELLKVWVNVQAQPTLREAQEVARKLLARIDGEKTDDEEQL